MNLPRLRGHRGALWPHDPGRFSHDGPPVTRDAGLSRTMSASRGGAQILRFVHTGDLHLDSPFVGLTTEAPPSVSDPPRVHHPRLAQHRRPGARGAGRLPPRRRRRLRARQPDAARPARLPRRPGPPGARPASPPSSSPATTTRWTAGSPRSPGRSSAHRFPAHEVTARPVLRDGAEIARVYGISYHQRDITTNLADASGASRTRRTPSACSTPTWAALEGAANYAPCSLGGPPGLRHGLLGPRPHPPPARRLVADGPRPSTAATRRAATRARPTRAAATS